MAHHSHVRFTPAPRNVPALTTYDISGLCARFDKYIVAHEISKKDAIPHYHIWLVSDVCKKTIDNYIHKDLGIPKESKRGVNNAYFSNKFDEYDRPSPEYVCKDGDIRDQKGYTEDEIKSFIEEGNKKYNKTEVRSEVIMKVPGAVGAANKSIEDVFDEYIEAVLPKDKNQPFSIESLKRNSINHWRSKSRLLPVRSTQQRFIASAWLEWCDITRRGPGLGINDLEEKNLL